MKAHELAKALGHLSRVLRAGPNIEIEDLANLSTHARSAPTKAKKQPIKHANEQGAALALLAEMAKYNKSELLELADFYGIPVEIRPADAVRDVLGKILKYIQENPNIQNRLAGTTNIESVENVPPLARALAILMGTR